MSAAVRTAFDIAFWFLGRARQAGEALQPLRLQQLLFMAQATFAAANGGRALMPAVFVADELGPLEPNVHAAFSRGRPDVDLADTLPVAVEAVIEQVWRSCARLPSDDLLALATATPAYATARARGLRTPIPLEQMAMAPAILWHPQPAATRPLRTQHGRTVRVGTWLPPAKGTTNG